MNILSQNDPRWKDIKLGTSTETIGGYGCAITSIAMIIGTTPDIVNQRLIEVEGYLNGNLVIWAMIEEAFPGIKVRRVWSYDNVDVKNNLPCMVEVDAAPIGGFRHWVVYTGNQRCYDPWDGHDDPTSDYPNPLSYCVLSGSWIKPITPEINPPMTDQTIIDLGQFGKHEIQAIRGYYAETTPLKTDLVNARKTIQELELENEGLDQANGQLENQLKECLSKPTQAPTTGVNIEQATTYQLLSEILKRLFK